MLPVLPMLPLLPVLLAAVGVVEVTVVLATWVGAGFGLCFGLCFGLWARWWTTGARWALCAAAAAIGIDLAGVDGVDAAFVATW